MRSGGFSRGWRIVSILAAFGLLIVLCIVGGIWFHYQDTPGFAEYVQSRPVASALAAARWPEAEVLATGPDWHIGEVDPSSLGDADALWRKHSIRFTSTIRHGPEPLACVVQELSIAAERDSGDRAGLALAMQVPQLDPRMRVIARVWIDDARVVGQGSQGKGSAVFDVMLVAGAGENELSVARLPPGGLESIEVSESPMELGRTLRGWIDPRGALPEEGLIHHVRRQVFLMWSDTPGQSQSAGHANLQTWMNTQEYSYSIDCKLEEQGWTSSNQQTSTLSWNGQVW